MTLIDIIRQINALDSLLVIFAKKPWLLSSEARLSKLDEGSRLPRAMAEAGFDYFLEIFVALEVLEVFGSRPVTDEQRAALLIYYAENDSFPEWAYLD